MHEHIGFSGVAKTFWERRKATNARMAIAFGLSLEQDEKRGKHFYETMNNVAKAAEAPRVDLVSTHYVVALLVDIAATSHDYVSNATAYFNYLLGKVCQEEELVLPLVVIRDTRVEHLVDLEVKVSGCFDASRVLGLPDSIITDAMFSVYAGRANISLLSLLIAVRKCMDRDEAGELKMTLYCLLVPLVSRIDEWVLRTGTPADTITSADDLMPRLPSGKSKKWLDPDTKMFIGWTVLRNKLARSVKAYCQATKGTRIGPPGPNTTQASVAFTNRLYAESLRRVMEKKMLMTASIDELTIDGAQYFVTILTDPDSTWTGYGDIQDACPPAG